MSSAVKKHGVMPDISGISWFFVAQVLMAIFLQAVAIPAANGYDQASSGQPMEQRVSQYFEAIRDNPEELRAFFLRMPKGGDLHNHLTGAVYAESLIDRAYADGLCIRLSDGAVSRSYCLINDSVPASRAYSDPNLYNRLVDDWSIRDGGPYSTSSHDHFFATFSVFGGATGNTSALIAELKSRAAQENVEYLEIMTSAGSASSEAASLGSKLGWDEDLTRFHDALIAGGLRRIAHSASDYLNKSYLGSLKILQSQGDAGSNLTVRYLYTAARTKPREQVFAQLSLAFEVAEISPLVVGINLLSAEDNRTARKDYSQHMRMVEFLHGLYPDIKIALHAGELDLGLVPPEDLRFHIREAVERGHASRIGHGVDIMHELNSSETLKEMARSGIAVEIMPASNKEILGVEGENHPFPIYLSRGVPIVLASDDPGVLRTDLTEQFVIIAHSYPKVKYADFKRFVRNSIDYSFLPGSGIWGVQGDYSQASPECANCVPGSEISERCIDFLEKNEKASAEWKLEKDLAAFERYIAAAMYP